MRKLGMIVVLGVAGMAVACGGSSSSSVDSGAGGTLGSCNAPSCLVSLYSSCQPSGTCVTQTDMTTFASNTCYSNGVKEIMTIAATGETFTVKNGTSTCYSFESDSTGAIKFKNGSGSVVATGTYNSATKVTTVTCTGGAAVTLNAACDSASSSSTANCTDGTCTP